MPANRTFEVKALSRVEGEGALYVKLDGDTVETVELNIYEPPRFFEAFLPRDPRSTGYHGPHLRDLPGGLPNELRARTREGTRTDDPTRDPHVEKAVVLRRVD